MSNQVNDENVGLLRQLVTTVQKKNDKEKVDNSIKMKPAKVIGVDEDTYKVFVYFIDDTEQNAYTFYNKSGEVLTEGDNVRVYYTTNPAKGWIGARCGETVVDTLEDKPMYISAKVANTQVISYDKIERELLSVDFTVEGTDSDVVFTGNQLCDVLADGNLSCIYKVDGATQDFKPVENFAVGKRIFSHIYPMTLTKGKHNFTIIMLSPDEGKGTVGIGGIIGALSGQISGLKNNAPPNEDLILYFSGVLANTEITLPQYMYYDSSAQKYVDWGDGSLVEDSVAQDAVSHTYTTAGDYTVTIKSDAVNFGRSANHPNFSDEFKQYITRIYFPDGAKEIMWGSSTENFPNLETLVFGKSATKIEWYFTASTNLTSLFIPETVTWLSWTDFRNTAVTSLIIPKNISYINGGGIFMACPSLKTLEVYGSSTLISASNSANLQKLVIGGNATRVGGYSGCSSLSDVKFTLPSKVNEIVSKSFQECTSLTSVVLPQTIEIIGSYAFEKCTSLSSIVLSDRLSEINTYMFRGCTSLVSVYLGKNITKILQYAFQNCSSLSNINFPDGLVSISDSAFQNTGAISPTFPASLVSIGAGAFNGSGITGAVLRSGMTCGGSAFAKSGLQTLVIEDGFGTIPQYCFSETSQLCGVSIPSSVEIISEYAFNKSGVSDVRFSGGLGTVKRNAFSNSMISNVTLPSTVTNVDYEAFYNCENLISVNLNSNVNLGNRAFYSCASLISVNMGSTNVISNSCFGQCTNLSSISFAPNTAIGSSAFSSCGFTSLNLLGYVQTQSELSEYGGMYNIGGSAFQNCASLTSVDGYEYKWDVGLKRKDKFKDENGNTYWVETDLGLQVEGIYDTMGAKTDSVFTGTGLKAVSDYPKPADTSDTTYIAYHFTGRNPAYTS